MNSSFINFYDEFVDDTVTLDIIDIEEITLIDGDMIIFNTDGLSFKTKNIKFYGR